MAAPADSQLRRQWSAAPRSRTTGPVLTETHLGVDKDLVKLIIHREQDPTFT